MLKCYSCSSFCLAIFKPVLISLYILQGGQVCSLWHDSNSIIVTFLLCSTTIKALGCDSAPGFLNSWRSIPSLSLSLLPCYIKPLYFQACITDSSVILHYVIKGIFLEIKSDCNIFLYFCLPNEIRFSVHFTVWLLSKYISCRAPTSVSTNRKLKLYHS